MRKVTKPEEEPIVVFLKCLENIESEPKKTRLKSYIDKIQAAAVDFEEKMHTTTIHTIKQNLQKEIVDDMVDIYTNKLARKGQPGRDIYDKLKSAPKFGICPLCGQGQVTTLDHHLAKTKYPFLAVAPINLVPSCSDCNKLKTAKSPTSSEEETFHPYYDNIENERWLCARIVETIPPAFFFYVNAPAEWDDVKIRRVENHFTRFELNRLYSSYAGQQLALDMYSLYNLFVAAGPEAVRTQLLEDTNSCEKAYLNSWQSAMYNALANSQWFCNDGIKELG